jgi:putative DNA-binding protein
LALSRVREPRIMTDGEIGLRRLQEIIYRLIAAPTGVAEGLEQVRIAREDGLDRLIASDDRMTPVERVEIYAQGYFYRILDVLKEDYPATLAVAGADNFHNLVTGYLIDYPPTEPSIYFAGQHLAAYLATHPLCERFPYLADLARLERTMLESFHAVDAQALDADAMRTIPPTEWPALLMRANPASRLMESSWRVDRILRAVEDGAAWHPPNRESVTIIVWRRAARVSFRVAEPGEREALRLASVNGGATFAAICEAIAAAAGANDDVAALINRLLARWLSDGLLINAAD